MFHGGRPLTTPSEIAVTSAAPFFTLYIDEDGYITWSIPKFRVVLSP